MVSSHQVKDHGLKSHHAWCIIYSLLDFNFIFCLFLLPINNRILFLTPMSSSKKNPFSALFSPSNSIWKLPSERIHFCYLKQGLLRQHSASSIHYLNLLNTMLNLLSINVTSRLCKHNINASVNSRCMLCIH